MLGFNHVTMAMGAGVLTLPFSGTTTTPTQLGWVATVGGLGLLCDLDMEGTTAARTWGPITAAMANGIGTLAGGHRRGTHDLVLAPLVFAGITAVAMTTQAGAWFVIALAIGLALQGLALAKIARVGTVLSIAISWWCAWWLVTHGHSSLFHALPLAVVVGIWAHLAGDGLTSEMLPLPIAWLGGVRRRIGLPLFPTGQSVELFVVTPLLNLAVVWIICRHLGVHDGPSFDAEVAHLLYSLAATARDALPHLLAALPVIGELLTDLLHLAA